MVRNKFITVQNVVFNMYVAELLKYFWICCFTVRYISESKIDRKPKRRVLDIVNSFLFIKTVSNNCITVENDVTNILLFCKAISEFVASRLARSRIHKSIENVKNRSSYIEAPYAEKHNSGRYKH